MTSVIRSVLSNITYYVPCCRRSRSNEQLIQGRLSALAPQERINSLLQNYYSSYVSNLLKVDEGTLGEMERVVRRSEEGLKIASIWEKVLFGAEPSLDATHRLIGNEALLTTALTAQLIFDQDLLRLKKIDRYQKLYYGKLLPELRLLEKVAAYEQSYWPFKLRLNDAEKPLIEQLKSKAQETQTPFIQVLQRGISIRKQLERELCQRIGQLKNEKEPTAWLSPDSEMLKTLIKESETEKQSPVKEDPSLHSSLKDHFVLARDDVLTERGQFIIAERPAGIPDAAWEKCISVEGTKKLFQWLKEMNAFNSPNHRFIFSFKENENCEWKVEVSIENAQEALGLHENRDLNIKTRRELTEEGYRRFNKAEEGSTLKDLARKLLQGDWSKRRAATAGADDHEAIWVNRKMVCTLLSGKVAQLRQNVVQNLGEYFDALPSNDAAKLKGSYLKDPRFKQAQNIHAFIHGFLKDEYFPQTALIPCLEKGTETDYSWKKDKVRLFLLVQDLFESYANWSKNLSEFYAEIQNPKNSKAAEEIGEETLNLIPPFIQSLNQFLSRAPSRAIQELLAQRRAIVEESEQLIQQRDAAIRAKNQEEYDRIDRLIKQNDQTKMRRLDEAGKQWQQGKTLDQLDQILRDSLTPLKDALKGWTPHLIQINVPFSSKQRQQEIEKAMSQELKALYQKAIPPIWQNKVKLQLLIEGELMKGTELSPLWLQQADLMEVAHQELMKNEFTRSSLAKKML